jgi:acylphosphatase
MTAERKRVVVRGRVQGVFFRDTTRRQAQAHGVSGWVRNRDDGAVEAAFEGEPAAVDAMLEFVRSGPRGSVVEDVEVVDEPAQSESGFRVS